MLDEKDLKKDKWYKVKANSGNQGYYHFKPSSDGSGHNVKCYIHDNGSISDTGSLSESQNSSFAGERYHELDGEQSQWAEKVMANRQYVKFVRVNYQLNPLF